MNKPTVGSLFAGIGGFDLGFERAGFDVKWQVEIDHYCRRVLAKHWPDVKRHDDVKTFPPTEAEEWKVDCIIGGFPCQDISVAGRGAGIDGERSGLWSEYARIVRLLRPRFVVVENVPALLARGLGRVLGDLAACGYDAEWDCLPAVAFGAPHIRDRVFVIAHANGERCQELDVPAVAARAGLADRGDDARPIPDAKGQRRRAWRPGRTTRLGSRQENTAAMADAERAEWGPGGSRGCGMVHAPLCLSSERKKDSGGAELGNEEGGGQWSIEPNVGRVAHGVPARVDRLRGLGNAVVPQVAEWIGRRVMEALSPA